MLILASLITANTGTGLSDRGQVSASGTQSYIAVDEIVLERINTWKVLQSH